VSQYTRAPYLDQYAEDGELAVMLADGRVVAVSYVAARVLELLEEQGEMDAAEVRLALERDPSLPPPPDGESSVLGVMGALEGVGLLGLSDPDRGEVAKPEG
jgi:hypothetical protein